MRKLLWLAAIVLLISPQASADCLPLDKMIRTLLAEKHQAYLSTAITKQGLVVQTYVNRMGEWTLIWISQDLTTSCIILEGVDWNFAIERRA